MATNLISYAQMPTIRQVFDYEINDEFHLHYYHGNGPPQGIRYKVIGKYDSVNGDTISYIMQNSNYSTTFFPSPIPHLDYTFSNFIDTISYTYLDSTIEYYVKSKDYLSLYTSSYYLDTSYRYCQSNLYGFSFIHGTFEPNIYTFDFATGLGLVASSFYASSYIPLIDDRAYNVYYIKGSFSCGLADTVGLSVEKPKHPVGISIYPNPTSDNLNINLLSINQNIEEIDIYDLQFRKLLSRKISSSQATIDVSKFAKGVYLVEGKTNTGEVFRKKFMVE